VPVIYFYLQKSAVVVLYFKFSLKLFKFKFYFLSFKKILKANFFISKKHKKFQNLIKNDLNIFQKQPIYQVYSFKFNK
jgi:hypothetical protein